VITYNVTATDPDDDVASFGCLPASGAVFPIGKTTVTCTAVDAHGNASRASFIVTVNAANHPMGLMWFNPGSGVVKSWLLNGAGQVTGSQSLSLLCGAGNGCSATWVPIGLGDVNGDGHTDLMWGNPGSGVVQSWLLNGAGKVIGSQRLSLLCGAGNGCSASWVPIGLGDVNGDGHVDLMWFNPGSGVVQSWLLNGAGKVTGSQSLSLTCGAGNGCSASWVPIGLGDVNGDSHVDLMWFNRGSGVVQSWLLNGAGKVIGSQSLSLTCGAGNGCSATWVPIGLGDVNGDGHTDLMWGNPGSGVVQSWLLNGAGKVTGSQSLSLTCGAGNGCSATWVPIGLSHL
jgi:hypothetical protein